jgi:hypothetical protein
MRRGEERREVTRIVRGRDHKDDASKEVYGAQECRCHPPNNMNWAWLSPDLLQSNNLPH